jgi:two-component system catabolic regulation response regulator CreB
MPKILVVDDEPGIRESLCYALEREGFEAEAFERLTNVEGALAGAELLVLDLMLPDGNGLEFLKRLRAKSRLPVIVLTSRAEELDRVLGLELGADDYVVKPFSPRELVARVRAVLRRVHEQVELTGSRGGLRVDLESRRAYFGPCELELSRLELDLLAVFVASPDRVFDRGQLLQRVWGPDCAVTERTIDVHINALRKKIELAGGDGQLLETVRGVGYRLRERSE